MNLKLDRCDVECAGQGDPIRLASAIHRQILDATGVVPVETIALALDILDIVEQPFVGIEAMLQTDRLKSHGVIAVRSDARSTRRRFSIAHELGHFLNERHQPTDSGSFQCTAKDMSSPFGEQRHIWQEREANTFAIELLTPRDRLVPILKRSADMERAMTIADRFEISREAALRRHVDLHHEVLAVAFSRNGRIRYSHKQDWFQWIQLTRGDEIGETPGASITGDPVTSLDEVDSGSWLQDGGDWQLFAQTLFQSDGYAATMLLTERRTDEDPDEPRFR